MRLWWRTGSGEYSKGLSGSRDSELGWARSSEPGSGGKKHRSQPETWELPKHTDTDDIVYCTNTIQSQRAE